MNISRNLNLDLMRFLGVVVIMIAHASPPSWLFQLRNFGTPLLIVASALTYAVIYENRELILGTFYKKRLSRLIIPAWIFLTFFFALLFFASMLLNRDYPFSTQEIFESYTFYWGIGYVWIFKVYIILALLTPFALKVRKANISNRYYFLILLLLYAFYELALIPVAQLAPENFSGFVNQVLLVIAPYALLYLYGMRLASLTDRQVLATSVISLFIFAALAFSKYTAAGQFIATQEFKYPPTLYYLSYALFATNLIYYFCRNITLFSLRASAAIMWLSSNSLWIYLWHILGVYTWNTFVNIDNVNVNFMFKMMYIFAFGILATKIQLYFVTHFISQKNFAGRKTAELLS